RGAADRGAEVAAGPGDRLVVERRPDPPQRMIGRDEGLQRDVVEERSLRIRRSHHGWPPPLTHATTSRPCRREQNAHQPTFVSNLLTGQFPPLVSILPPTTPKRENYQGMDSVNSESVTRTAPNND